VAATRRLHRVALLSLLLAGWSGDAAAMCDVIPGVVAEYRGARGTLNRPFAFPGDVAEQIRIRLKRDPGDPLACEVGRPGFENLNGGIAEDDYFVTVLFEPPALGAPRHAVVLTTAANEETCDGLLNACRDHLSEGSADCVPYPVGPDGLLVFDADTLVFRFPDTDLQFLPDADDLTFSGPAAIAVTPVGQPLPCGLAQTSCAACLGGAGGGCPAPTSLIACVDELYARDGTCDTSATPNPAGPHATFPHFTALPAANDYSALCTPAPGSPCVGGASQLRLTVDKDGNALLPMDWRGVLVVDDRIPIPRIVRGQSSFPKVLGGGDPVHLPSDAFIDSFSPGGHLLPPIFTPVTDPNETLELALFGSVDAPVGVVRVQQRGCVGGAEVGRACTLDAECGAGGTCETLFEFADRLEDSPQPGHPELADSGPILVGAFQASAESPVPIDGLIESPDVFAFVASERIEQQTLNLDSDTTDSVLRLRSRRTAVSEPIGRSGTPGRAAVRIQEPPFSFPAVETWENIVAFLEPEPLEGNCAIPLECDRNDDDDVADTILRVYRLDEAGCTPGMDCAREVTAPPEIAADAEPAIDGRSLAISEGIVYFRRAEWASAHRVTRRVSVTDAGSEADDSGCGFPGFPEDFCGSQKPSLSSDGRFVAFHSSAENLTANDLPFTVDVFVHDRDADGSRIFDEGSGSIDTRLVSRNPSGNPTGEDSEQASISGDGRFVAFRSQAWNLGFPDPNGLGRDVYLYDLALDSIVRRVSDTLTAGESTAPEISSDGTRIAFRSDADDLVPSDNNGGGDVFLFDSSMPMQRVSLADGGGEAISGCSDTSARPPVAISGDGGAVAFACDAPNLVLPPEVDSNLTDDVFIHDVDAIDTERVSVATGGAQAEAPSDSPALSADGRIVAFRTAAPNLVAGDTNGVADVFVRDLRDPERLVTTRVSVASDGKQGTKSVGPGISLSADGRYVAFASGAPELAALGQNGTMDVFAHDRVTGLTALQSVIGVSPCPIPESQRNSRAPALSADGRFVAFDDSSPCLVADDTNDELDVFVTGPDTGDLTADRTGDDDVDDVVLEALVGATGMALPLKCPAGSVATSGGNAAFLRPERAGPADGCPPPDPTGSLNGYYGDTDAVDEVVHLSMGGAAPANLRVAASAVDLSGSWIAALVHDGGQSDEVWVAPMGPGGAGAWTDLGLVADALQVEGPRVAFTVPEPFAGGTRRILHVYDAGGLVDTGQAAEEFVLGEDLVAFRTSEQAQGAYLNTDGDQLDTILQVWDFTIPPGRRFNTQRTAIRCPLEACDPRFPYRVTTGTPLTAPTVVYLTSEVDEGQDLNGDDDSSDIVKQVFNAREAALVAPPSGEAPGCSQAIASASKGICSTNGAACVEDENCGGGRCFLPPGRCLRPTGANCTCNDVSGDGLVCTGCAPKANPPQVCVESSGENGICVVVQEECTTTDACFDAAAFCADTKSNASELLAPVSARDAGGEQLLVSAGTCVQDLDTLCSTDDACRPISCGSACRADLCGAGGTCERRFGSCLADADCDGGLVCAPNLVVAGAGDGDGDGVADPFDDCPADANPDQEDTDGDGVGDACDPRDDDADGDAVPAAVDNCTALANSQIDSNLDGYGNRCDADYNNDGAVGLLDFAQLRMSYGQTSSEPGWNADLDSNGDGVVGTVDFALLRMSFGSPPGPSGLACAGSTPCPP